MIEDNPRIFRSPKAHFDVNDAIRAADVYTAEELRAIAGQGYNGVWVRVLFRDLTAHSSFPEFGREREILLSGLRKVIERGESCGVKLYLYCQEPLGMNREDPFWQAHPETAGSDWDHNFGTHGDNYMRAMCTSSPAVKAFIRDGAADIARDLPGMGGLITITASEFMSHCYSHYHVRTASIFKQHDHPLPCPRCRERKATDIVAEILNLMREGLDSSDPSLPLIAWNWSWYMYQADPQPAILEQLMPRIDILADFERGGRRTDPGGRDIDVDEYSLVYPGPSERFRLMHEQARKAGRRILAKLQIGTTHEAASVSNLPLIDQLCEKAGAFREWGVDGFMGTWNFGNERSLNTYAFPWFCSRPAGENCRDSMTVLARERFPGCSPDKVVSAWRRFGTAFAWHPFSIPFLYYGPLNYALSLPVSRRPLHGKPAGRSWQMDPRDECDDYSRCFGPFTLEEITDRLEKMAAGWDEGLAAYEKGLENAGGPAQDELNAARAIAVCIHSTAHFFRLYQLKLEHGAPPEEPYREILRREMETVERALPVYRADRRQGFHGEAFGYMVTPERLEEKLADIEAQLKE